MEGGGEGIDFKKRERKGLSCPAALKLAPESRKAREKHGIQIQMLLPPVKKNPEGNIRQLF